MTILGYGLAVLMGAVLGLIGGGGSILTVPILVYVFGIPAGHATAYSLFVVGFASSIAAIDYKKRELIDFKVGITFAIPAFTGVYLVRRFLMPVLPEVIWSTDSFVISKDNLILSVFSLVMLVASISMIRGRREVENAVKKDLNLLIVTAEGLVVGALTGFVGAGGGFMIIPALVILAGLNMKIAIGTSLFIISVKSLIGFVGDVQSLPDIDWWFLVVFTAFSVAGIFLGTVISRRVDSSKLKTAFGWFVLVTGTLMLIKETLG